MEQEADNVVGGGQGSARQAGCQHLQNQFETTVSINDSYHCFNLNKCPLTAYTPTVVYMVTDIYIYIYMFSLCNHSDNTRLCHATGTQT